MAETKPYYHDIDLDLQFQLKNYRVHNVNTVQREALEGQLGLGHEGLNVWDTVDKRPKWWDGTQFITWSSLSGDFISNQNALAQPANFWINGNGRIDNTLFSKNIVLPEQVEPGLPGIGTGIMYPRDNGRLYWKNDGGIEYDLTAVPFLAATQVGFGSPGNQVMGSQYMTYLDIPNVGTPALGTHMLVLDHPNAALPGGLVLRVKQHSEFRKSMSFVDPYTEALQGSIEPSVFY